MIKRKGNVYKLDTPNTTLLIRVGETAEYLYYGKRLNVPGSDYEPLKSAGEGREPALKLVSSFGGEDVRRFGVACTFADGSFSARFIFLRAKFTEKPDLSPLPSSYSDSLEKSACQTLALEFLDEASKLKLFVYYTVFEDSDVIAVSSRLFNGGRKEVRVKNLASLQLDVYGGDYSFVAFRGAWANERNKISLPVNGAGIVCNETTSGGSSHHANPFVMLERPGCVYAFNLVYSGNHKETAEADLYPRTRVLVGLNDFLLDKKLEPGESFSSPEAVMAYAPDEDGVSRAMHRFVSRHIVRGRWKERERPIVVNNWEGTYFDFDRERILAIAKKSAEVGAELFVLDDGWFGHRDGDDSSLGDWFDYAEKTGGIASLADEVRRTGLKFGIWVEPEMISENSELYRKHPEFAMRIPGREPLRMRNQLMLNLADPKVQKYVIRAVSAVIAETKASYVKWDYNRRMSDCFGREIPAGEYFLRYTEGLYTVMGKLVEKFPGVLFEGCASGGGRFDLGILCFMPQIWTSDNTDARCRLSIQSGTSYAYPPSAAAAHVSASPNHQTGNLSALETRFNVAAFGVCGYETDLTRLTDAETETVKKQILFYKKYRRLFQYGAMYRLGDAFGGDDIAACGFICVSENKTSAVALGAVKGRTLGAGAPRLAFKGLDEGTMYTVSVRKQDNYVEEKSFVCSGELLMNGTFGLEGIFRDTSFEAHGNSLFTKIFIFEKLKKNKNL